MDKTSADCCIIRVGRDANEDRLHTEEDMHRKVEMNPLPTVSYPFIISLLFRFLFLSVLSSELFFCSPTSPPFLEFREKGDQGRRDIKG